MTPEERAEKAGFKAGFEKARDMSAENIRALLPPLTEAMK
jgi:hypothetical protein